MCSCLQSCSKKAMRTYTPSILLILLSACAFKAKEQTDQKVLFVVSNAHYYGTSDINTANHFAEIVFAYEEFIEAGYTVDFVSPKGGYVPIGYVYSDTLLMRYLYDGDFMDQLEQTKRPIDVRAEDYQAIFYAGGGAAMFGVPSDKAIQQIAMDIYENQNGVVSAVCHGTAGIANIQASDGSYFVSGKRVNGFPDLFENKDGAYFQEFPFSIEEQIERNGGIFRYSKKGWDGYLEIDGKLITGQDPSSSALVARAVIETLEKNISFN